jgi:hypothetical protein
MIAAMNGNYPVVSYLIHQGANMQLESKDGKTAKEFALESLAEYETKKNNSHKEKLKMDDLRKILNLLPDDDIRVGDVSGDETPH